jgi:hypothetical protein
VRKPHTILHRHLTNRNKWQHIGRAKTRVFASVRAHVDQLRGTFHGLDRGIDNILGRRHKRDYGPVVVRVDMRIQHAGGPHRRDGRRYLFDRLRPSPFAKIWDTLD